MEKGDDEGVSAHGMNVRGSRTQIVNAEGETIIARSAHLSTRDADAIRESADTIDLAVDVDEKAVGVVGSTGMCLCSQEEEWLLRVLTKKSSQQSHPRIIHRLNSRVPTYIRVDLGSLNRQLPIAQLVERRIVEVPSIVPVENTGFKIP